MCIGGFTMLRCKLGVLLAQKNVSITKLSQETGISRTTLNSLDKNYSTGIQFKTIDSVCTYLNISPSELFEFYPGQFDLCLNLEINSKTTSSLLMETRFRKYDYEILTHLTFSDCKYLFLDIYFEQPYNDDLDIDPTESIQKFYDEMPQGFKQDIDDLIRAKLFDIAEEIVNKSYDEDYLDSLEVFPIDVDFQLHF